MLKKIEKLISLFFCLTVIISCVQDLDFTQLDRYSPSPILSVAAVNFTILPSQFFDQFGVQINELEEASEISSFKNNTLINNIKKIEFNAEVFNDFDTDFIVQVQLLDINYLPIYDCEEMVVKAKDLAYEFKEIVDFSSNPRLYVTKGFRVKIKNTTPSVILDPKDIGKFQFSSFFKIYLEIDA